MYYMRNRSEVSGAEVQRSEGSESGVRDSEVQGAVVRRFEYRFQPSWNRYVTTVYHFTTDHIPCRQGSAYHSLHDDP